MPDSEMTYSSTRGESEAVPFLDAMERGLAPDGGLYLPDHWPDLREEVWNSIGGKSIAEIGTTVSRKFIPELPAEILRELVDAALSFDAPLRHLHDNRYILELFHGPTLAFKDFGARFMAQVMNYAAARSDRRMVILVATSGDTGSAVGRAFEGLENIDVCLLYPSGKVSRLQEQQLTAIGGNVTALEVEGTFDDCQQLVKQAFSDEELRGQITLSSANSINIARLLPQMFYYGRALAQLTVTDTPVHFCVPSGNFGNLTAGLMAARTGMPAGQFLAGTNINDVVPRFLRQGVVTPQLSRKTISSAMDVGDPSNLERIRAMFPALEKLRRHLRAASFDDEQTREAIRRVYGTCGYVLDPHTAVGCLAAEKFAEEIKTEEPVIILATAHPAKFPGIVEPLIGHEITLPDRLRECLAGKKESTRMAASYHTFRDFLTGRYSG